MVFLNNDALFIGELYDEFHKDVYHFSLYLTNSKQDAEDVAQETFVKALSNFHQLKDHRKKKSWILSIARNTAVDLIRRQRRIRYLPKLLVQENHLIRQAPSNVSIIAEENWVELQTALLKLKPYYRSVVILRALNELSVKETAEVLKCSEGKVRVDFHRALNLLKNDLNLKEGWKYYEESR
jgi:RNA polymerase sigma-70 factor (ECF subfamily)